MTKGTSITRMKEQYVQKLLALHKDKREALWYFEPEHAVGNHNRVQCNHHFSAICFLRPFTDFLSCKSIFIQLPSSFSPSEASPSASRNVTFPCRMFPASLWFFLCSTHLLRANPSPLYYITNNFSSLSCIPLNLWVLTVKFSSSFAMPCKPLHLPCLPSFSNPSSFCFKYLHFDGQLDAAFVTALHFQSHPNSPQTHAF